MTWSVRGSLLTPNLMMPLSLCPISWVNHFGARVQLGTSCPDGINLDFRSLARRPKKPSKDGCLAYCTLVPLSEGEEVKANRMVRERVSHFWEDVDTSLLGPSQCWHLQGCLEAHSRGEGTKDPEW